MKITSLAGILCVLTFAGSGLAIPPDHGGATAAATLESGTAVRDDAKVRSVLSFPSVTDARTTKAVPQGTCTPIPTATAYGSSMIRQR